MLVTAVLVPLVSCAANVLAAPELQYCRINDPNLGRCLTKAFNTVIRSAGNGSAAYGVKPLELLEVPYLEFSMGAGNVSADIRLKNVAIKGLSKINVMTVKFVSSFF